MNKFIEIAKKEAKLGIRKKEGGPFGAVIVKNGKIIAKAHNKVLKNKDPTCHAEIEAIKKACKKLKSFDLTECEIYSTSEPCPMCLGAILWARIKKVYYACDRHEAKKYGFDDELFYDLILSRKSKRSCDKIIQFKQLNKKQCLEIFEEFNNMEDKELY